MKRTAIIIMLISASVIVRAEDNQLFSFGFHENAVTYVFAENVRVRKAPGIEEGNVIDTLNPGHEVFIVKVDDKLFSMNGISENWLYVKYSVGGKEKKGYVWGGLVSIAWIKNGKDFILTGMRKYTSLKGLEGECRVVSAGKITASLPV